MSTSAKIAPDNCGLHLDLATADPEKVRWFEAFAQYHNHRVKLCDCGMAVVYVPDRYDPELFLGHTPWIFNCSCGQQHHIYGSRILAMGRMF